MNLSEIKAAPDEERKAFDPLPEGNYPVTVINAEETVAKTGTPGVVLELEVQSGKHQGRKVWDRLWLTPKAKWRVRDVFGALGLDLDALGDEVSETVLIGRRAVVLVAHEQYVNNAGEQATRVSVAAWGEHPDGAGETRKAEPVKDDDLPF